MKKLLMLLIMCCFITACDNKASKQKLPLECVEAFSNWDTLLEKMAASGKFSNQTLTAFKENQDFIFNNISNSPDTDKQTITCKPINALMKKQLQRIANIQSMSQEDIDYHFGVTRLR